MDYDNTHDERAVGIIMQSIPRYFVSTYKINPLSSVYISSVINGSPADRCGLVIGDIIYAVDGQDIPTMNDFRKSVQGKETVQLHVWRKGGFMRVRCSPIKTEQPMPLLDVDSEMKYRIESYKQYYDRESLKILSVNMEMANKAMK
jgi:C-terminal processing protease CtpA/Prc